MPIHVLQNDDRVIHHHADRQDHRQQGQQIDGEAEQQHHEQSPDQRQRHRYGRDQDATNRAQEKVDHDHDDQHRFDQCADHLVNRVLDVLGCVVGDRAAHPFGKLIDDAWPHIAYALHHIEHVGVGRDLNTDEGGAIAVPERERVVVLGTEFDACDIAQSHDGTAVRANRELAEFLRSAQIGIGRQVDLDVAALGLANSRQKVVGLQRLAHITRRQVEGGKTLRLQPDSHRELAGTEHIGALNPFQGGQLRFDHTQHVVGHLVFGQHVAVERQVHGRRVTAFRQLHDRVFRAFWQFVAQLVDLGGNLRQGFAWIGVQTQVGVDRADALTTRRHQIVDAFRRGDFTFQRCRDEAFDQIGVGADIGRGDRNLRVLDFRKLPHAQIGCRAQAQQQNHQTDDCRQDRPLDEGIGKGHDGCGLRNLRDQA